ncbi:TRAP transporter small permease [Salinibacillus xinjiangensis]|uniref:TRAP transporter small permease subunit n=1 Tax=Salinibacillus xinjiangensis TaxID=1229268 RepID=A0A6G1X8N5_9BACI|nr:TRAP transporter small permease [Salinibacillus xinjiangensis]MRG87265.1 TRAP transporter small permease subunit [Salinibacillus xinjiangensis]
MKRHRDLAYFLRYLCSFLLLVIVVVTLLQVFFRFVLDSPLTWTDELSRLLLVWVVFLGVGVVSFDDKHLAVNMLQENMSPRVHLITTFIMRIIIMIFLVILILTSLDVVKVAHLKQSGALEIPFSFWRVAAPVGAGVMIFFTIMRSINDIKDFKAGVYHLDTNNEEVNE